MRELVGLQLAQQYATGFKQQARGGRVFRGNIFFADLGTTGRQDALGVVDVLQRERNAVQRPAVTSSRDIGFGYACLLAREVESARDERVQLRFESLDALDQRFGVFERREFARADEVGRFGDGEEMQICCHMGKPRERERVLASNEYITGCFRGAGMPG